MKNKVIDCIDFSLCMLDEISIKEICQNTQNISKIGDFFSVKVNHEVHWLKKLENNDLWTDKSGYLALVDNGDKVFGVIWHFSHCIDKSFEIGINIFNPEYRVGKGFGSTAVKAYCNYLFEAYPINRLQYNMVEDNIISEKLAQKIGFKYEGIQRKALFIRGQWRNVKMYSLLREEYGNESI
ncbi:MAG: GNAT family N-acetyltransferase [gamma proteobacterium symbiont of Taylorina sp.]|nr:GNAT family N-acetyltransferase [gamma proteobacterium symbiont of Taylorina sp.]